MPRVRRISLGPYSIVDIRHFWPALSPAGTHDSFTDVNAIAIHHDAVLMAAGDRNYNGSTLDEDIQRLNADQRHAVSQGWGTISYHAAASPNGRTFYTLDLSHKGAHVGHHNGHLRGVVLLGDFTNRPPELKQLCAAGLAVALIRLALGRNVPIHPHSHWSSTSCPGGFWPNWMPQIDTFAHFHQRRLLDSRAASLATIPLTA